MKKLCTFICMIVVVLSTINTPALAAEHKTVIDLGNGYYAVETVTQYASMRSSGTITGSKTRELYFDATLIGTTTLTAAFDTSGSTAKATAVHITGAGKNGGAYLRGTTRLSGNTAYGTAYFSYSGVEKSMNISLSCSSDGTLS